MEKFYNNFVVVFISSQLNHSENRVKYILFLAVSIVAFLQLSNFLSSFRIVGDDNYYFYKGLLYKNDCEMVFREGLEFARTSGRIGHLVGIPLALVSNVLLEYSWFKYFILFLYALYGLGAFGWLSQFSGTKIAVLGVILYFSLSIVGDHHWQPNAYGYTMLNFAGLYLLRLLMQTKSAVKYIVYVLFLIDLLSYEYNLVAFPLMLLVEYFYGISDKKGNIRRILTELAKSKRFKSDVFLVIISWFIYFVYKKYSGGRYAGSEFNLDVNIFYVLKIQFEHLYSAMSLRYLKTIYLLDYFNWKVVVVGFTTFISVYLTFEKLREALKLKHILTGLLWGVLLAFFMTLIVALTPKYQDWCMNGECAYMDGRVAFVGVVAVISSLLFLLYYFIGNSFFRKMYVFVVALLVSFVGIFTYSANIHFSEKLKRKYEFPYQKIRNYVCMVGNNRIYDEEFFSGIVQERFPWLSSEPKENKKEFLKLYSEKIRNGHFGKCYENIRYQGDTLFFYKNGNGVKYLMYGWEFPDTSGSIAVGDSALIMVKWKKSREKSAKININLKPFSDKYIHKKKFYVKVNKCFIDSFIWNSNNLNIEVPGSCSTDSLLLLHFYFNYPNKDRTNIDREKEAKIKINYLKIY